MRVSAFALPKILIVDDEADIRFLVASVLKPMPYQLSFAENGTDALAAMRQDVPDLVLLDLMMPAGSGTEIVAGNFGNQVGQQVLRIMRSEEKLRGIKVIVLTAVTDSETKAVCWDHNALAYITKPFKNDVLVEKIMHWMQIRFESEIDERIGELWRWFSHHAGTSANLAGGGSQILQEILRQEGDTLPNREPADNAAGIIIEGTNMLVRAVHQGQALHELSCELRSGNPSLRVLNLADVMEEALENCGELTERAMINMSIDCPSPDEKDPCLIRGHHKLPHAICAVLENAASCCGGADLHISLTQEYDKYIISIEDTGPGIWSGLLEKIFIPFQAKLNTPTLGPGLGLPIAAFITKLSGGTLFAESEMGVGSKFVFTFPVMGG